MKQISKTQTKTMETKMKKQITITVKKEITQEQLSDLLCSALEGGSNYWYKEVMPLGEKKKYSTSSFYAALIEHGFTIKDKETGEMFTVKPEKFEKAFQLMADDYARHFNDFINDGGDAETADVFLQLCVFEDIIFG